MIKKLSLLCCTLVLFLSVAKGQTTLPTSFDFETTPSVLPNGWTTNTDNFYSMGFTGLGGRLDGTGDYFDIYLADEPGIITYYLRGFVGSGSWQGTFELYESPDGNNWSVIRAFTDGQLSTANYVLYTDTADRDSRYISFYFTNKVSGSNVGIDNVNIAIAPPPTTAEINVLQNSSPVPSGGTAVVNAPLAGTDTLTLEVENIGTIDTLFLGTPALSGTNASDFSIISYENIILANNSGLLKVAFSPAQAGTRQATLSIPNNDSNEDPYVINLYGVGGSYATEPTVQPTNLSFSGVTSYTMDATFTPASPAPEAYIVLRKKGAAVTEIPADGIAYQSGDMIGAAKVVFSANATAFTPNDIVANSDYNFAVFSYNGSGQFTNYLTTTPLTGNQASSGNMMGSYYSGISTGSATFIDELKNKVRSPYQQIFYSDYTTTLINEFYARDTTGGQKVVTGSYTGLQKIYNDPFDWTIQDMSREHTFPRSWMPDPATSTDTKEGSDLHNLVPVSQSYANAIRSNYPFGEVVSISYQYLDGKLGQDSAGNEVYEPKDDIKGNVARAIFYMCLRYDDINGEDWGIPTYISNFLPYGQDQDLLKKWHWQDPPDNFEIARNDYIQAIQKNRNPFIDSTQFVCEFNFYTMNRVQDATSPCYTTPQDTIGIAENSSGLLDIVVFPNPSSGKLAVSVLSSGNGSMSIRLLDTAGKAVLQQEEKLNSGRNTVNLSTGSFNQGIYILQIETPEQIFTEKWVRY